MHLDALNKQTLSAFSAVRDVPIVKSAYLAGGTAIALHLGHRISEDLDFFTLHDFEEDDLERQLSTVQNFTLTNKSWKSIKGEINGVKFSLFWYKYPLIEAPDLFEGVNVLKLPDLCAMKLHAITGRGVKRDYIDLYYLRKLYRQVEVVSYYDKKYGDFNNRAGMIFKALSYLDDANETPMPIMLKKLNWDEVKRFFEQEAVDFAREFIGLDKT